MTGTEIAVRQNGTAIAERDVVDGWVAIASDVIKLAVHICDTEFVPRAYRGNAPATAAAILAGRELGIGPMTSLRHVQVVEGSPSLSAEYKRARVLSAGHEFDILELNTQRCRVAGRRRGSTKPPLEITFTMEDAQRAGLLRPSRSGKPGAWQTRPRRMLFARAGTELCDFLFADATNGLPTAELLSEGIDGDGFEGYDEAPSNGAEPPKTAQRTPRRRQAATQTASPAAPQTPAADAPSSPVPAAGEAPQPPLPGEEDVSGPAVPDGTPGSGPAAGPETPNDTDYDSPGTVTPGPRGQLTKIGALFTGLGFTKDERDQRLVVASEIIGRDIGSSSDLSRNEASVLIDTLARCDGSREKLIALLAAGEVPEAGDG